MHSADSFARSQQQVAVMILADGKNLIARESVASGIDAARVPEFDQAPVMKADPDSAAVVLINRRWLVARQSLRHAIVGEGSVAEAIQAAVHAHPEVAFSVFVDASHPIGFARSSGWVADEPVAL